MDMWPRRRLDIGWMDLLAGFAGLVRPSGRLPTVREVVGANWVPVEEAFVTLSVRTGWDLFLEAAALPAGSEILVSNVTIPDMVRILERHGLVPVPVNVDARRLEIDAEALERLVTPRTRGVLVAHLFGCRMDMGPIVDVARRHGLFVVEDCAQAFVGREYVGHPASDCVLFSFGPIKTATALGGAVVRVRDAGLHAKMMALQDVRTVQSRMAFAKRLVKYAVFRGVSTPWLYGWLVRALKWRGIDYDRVLSNAAHSFGGDDAEFFVQIRRRLCGPLVRLLARRLQRFEPHDAAKLRRRRERGQELARRLPAGMVVGSENPTHTYWVLPLRVGNLEMLVEKLCEAGFDATGQSSLVVVGDTSAHEFAAGEVPSWLNGVVFLPSVETMLEREWQRLARIVERVAVPIKEPVLRELLVSASVSGTI